MDQIRKCRVCSKTSDVVKFHATKNLCIEDNRRYMAKWASKNKEHIKEYRGTSDFKTKRRQSVSKAQQRSPEAFLRYLCSMLRRQSNHKRTKLHKLNPACLDVQVVYEDLLALYQKQGGCCAILNIPMTHEFNNLRSISVDRIDSSLGYIPGNVQLVCQFINTAKKDHTNAECISILEEFLIRKAQHVRRTDSAGNQGT